MFKKEFYLKEYDCWDGPPEGVRLSEGPRMTEHRIPWGPDQNFCRVEDLDTGEIWYLTSWETTVKTLIPRSTLKRKLKKGKPFIHKDKYKIEKTLKEIFVKETGRTHDISLEYFYKY